MAARLLQRCGALAPWEGPSAGAAAHPGIVPIRGGTIKGGSGGLPLYVQSWAGVTHCVEASPDDTVMDLKRLIEEVDGTPSGIQRLVFCGVPLSDNRVPLADIGLGAEAVVNLEAAAEDAVCDLDVQWPPACQPGCRGCRMWSSQCGGTFRRALPDTASREIDRFVLVHRASVPDICQHEAMHRSMGPQWNCPIGTNCWYKLSKAATNDCTRIIRKVKKGRTLKGGLSLPQDWELHHGGQHISSTTLLAQWDPPAGCADSRHLRGRGGRAYPTCVAVRHSVPDAARLKQSRFKVEEREGQ
eukprot:TRINITY_DN9358_c0_g1_i1.p1 TRINITY_DN9358_c0_g1~~TRINITY_DN9358_c0_g1_i1.p1  ORF type:complete len:300 (+),score=62.77 TRINITY_DN9358_c0_g1_i1:75-974(+)